MKIDQNVLVIGGIIIVAAVALFIYAGQNRDASGKNFLHNIGDMLSGGGLTPGDEVEQAAMYSSYG